MKVYEGDFNKPIKIEGKINEDFYCVNAFFHQEVIISNCFFSKFDVIGSNFYQGLYIKNCIIENSGSFQSGGYNQKPIQIIDSKFKPFFEIVDCIFEDSLVLENVDFSNGTSLFGNIGTPLQNDFEVQPTLMNVTGKLDIKTYKY